MSQLWDFPPPGDDPGQTWEGVKYAFQQEPDSKPAPKGDGSGARDPQGEKPDASSEYKNPDDKPSGRVTPAPANPPISWGLWTKPKAKYSEGPEHKLPGKKNWGLWENPKAKDSEKPQEKSTDKKTPPTAGPSASWDL
ncbi:uncharacterized protein DNG_06651 [Cephalotrichum gorgonifer]|uniref:Uncharacterized protein n=1 Tax=Cephalotrichum gorgonifer TaxID=2041049 RepID=A0AAE8N2V4_9PEZI|nr:uncharacterized protein DNG_06651 [Cephalotrichum gorgonifer]